jgi:alanine dehydrogenase
LAIVDAFNVEVAHLLLLSRREIEEYLTMDEALKTVERAFSLEGEAKVVMPPKIYLDLPEYQGDFRAMPAYIDGSAGLKWVSVYPNNWKSDLQSVIATIILSDPRTGYPLAIMDGTYITDMRTGAAGGIAVKYLAKKDSSVIGMVGAGRQAKTQLLAISEVLPTIKEVKVFDQQSDESLRFAKEMVAKLKSNIYPVQTPEKAAEADIVVTTTPSRTPIVKKQFIKPGTHINAIGADAKGKQELEGDLLRNAKLVVDNIEQASHSGEINVPLSDGVIRVEDIYATLGELIIDQTRGRKNDEEITIFDSTGLAILDILCAALVYEKARKECHGTSLTWDQEIG